MVDFRDRVDKLLKVATKVIGETCEWRPLQGGIYQIKGIFDNDYEAVDASTEQLISSQIPALGVNLHQLSGRPKPGDGIIVRNLAYKITEVREDGQGGATLFLHKENHAERIRKKKNQE
tara:strand:+ start:6796 stop:7152 length:357 start_codon:yes stop_codon:yes gene_type:complete